KHSPETTPRRAYRQPRQQGPRAPQPHPRRPLRRATNSNPALEGNDNRVNKESGDINPAPPWAPHPNGGTRRADSRGTVNERE
ncbi:Hypothetical predicted protein, partial [Pelobates cultripes]